MKFTNWKLDRIENVAPEDFFNLIDKNKERLKNTFPVTLSHCSNLEETKYFLEFNNLKKIIKKIIFSLLEI